jgi:pSer/pThr/pTyr-binding forkhead associated (FHA) protein
MRYERKKGCFRDPNRANLDSGSMHTTGSGGRFATTIGAPTEAPSRASAADRSYLLVFEGDSSSVFELPRNGDVILGRGDDATLRLNDPAISRKHARIAMAAGEAHVNDLGSQNGTLVNGERICGSRVLVSTDVLSICAATLVFHSSARPAPARPLLELPELRLRAEEELVRTLSYHRPLTIAAISLGEGGGDRPRVSRALADPLRRIDIAGWGGADLLLIIMPEMPPRQPWEPLRGSSTA